MFMYFGISTKCHLLPAFPKRAFYTTCFLFLQYMLNKVRAIIKASREAVLKEDSTFMDDS